MIKLSSRQRSTIKWSSWQRSIIKWSNHDDLQPLVKSFYIVILKLLPLCQSDIKAQIVLDDGG